MSTDDVCEYCQGDVSSCGCEYPEPPLDPREAEYYDETKYVWMWVTEGDVSVYTPVPISEDYYD